MSREDLNASLPPALVLEPARVLSVHDGDTFRVGFAMAALLPGATAWSEDVRLAHVNAPELATPEGKSARSAVLAWTAEHEALRLFVWGREKYGRLLADVAPVDAPGSLLSDYVAGLPGTRRESVRRQLLDRP